MYLVTGGAGFIGSHLAEKLKSVVLDDFSEGTDNTLGCVTIQGDVTRLNHLEAAFQGQQAVFHFAAMADVRQNEAEPRNAFRTNVQGTLNVLDACRKADVKRFVFASSSAVYGETAASADENTPPAPQSTYGATKAAGEAFVSAYAKLYGIKSSVFRFANIYGPRSRRGVMFDFYHKLLKNPQRLDILGDGRQSKSYVYVEDAVNAVLLAFRKQKTPFELYNVGAKPRPVVDVAKAVCDAAHLHPEFFFSGGRTGWLGDVPKTWLDSRKLEKLGWKPKVPLEDGVKRYVLWLRKEGKTC